MNTKQLAYRYIPNKTLKKLNKIALRHGMNCLTDDCPVLRDGFNAPVFSHFHVDTVGWVRCVIPATPDCSHHVCLDVRKEDFEALPLSVIESGEEQSSSEPEGGQS